MESMIVILVAVVFFVLAFRLVGAWMLRINEVIREIKRTNTELMIIQKLLKDKELN